MICLKNGRQAFGQPDRDRRAVEVARRTEMRRVAWAFGEAAYEAQMVQARPASGSGRRAVDYPTAVRAALAAWDKEMSN